MRLTLNSLKKGLVKTVGFRQSQYVGDPINAVKIFNEKEVDENLDMSEKSGILAEGTKLKESDTVDLDLDRISVWCTDANAWRAFKPSKLISFERMV